MPIDVWTPQNAVHGAAFVVVAATVAHLLFSRLGFNPSDDGFILAGSRRILDGEVPHRDFISIRPALSHILHVPVLVLGGDRAILLGRYVFWLQVASMAWIWSCIFPTSAPFASATIAFVLSASVFPPMPWHTVDALLLTTVGFSLLPSPWGLLIAGLAPLCRQNFGLLIPILALLHGGLLSSLLLVPGLLYVAWIGMSGGARDMWHQLTVYQGPSAFHVGVRMYANVWTALGLLAGAAATRPGGGTAIAGMAALWVLTMYLTGESGRMAYFVFGLGVPVAARLGSPEGAFVLAAAWVASLSVGYPFPAMAAGAVFLMAAQAAASPSPALIAAAVVAVLAFIPLRRRHVYRQPPAKALGFDLTGILDGAGGIQTSETTREALADLQEILGRLREKTVRYAIIPDLPAIWARSSQRNPISCDWPQDTELGSEALRQRVQREMDSNGDLNVVLQKFETRGLMEGFLPLPERYSLVTHARCTRIPVEETRFFTVLGPAGRPSGPVKPEGISLPGAGPVLLDPTNERCSS